MNIDQFDFELPPGLIAQHPPAKRGGGRLLRVDQTGDLTDKMIADLPSLLRADDLLIFNDTRVIPARCYGQKKTGGKVEVLLERIIDDHNALVQLGTSKRINDGLRFSIGDAEAVVVERQAGFFKVCFNSNALQVFETHGHVPLPPYIRRQDDSSDRQRYQTVLAEKPGAVAAPTAGLHFDEAMLKQLAINGTNYATITLHVGAGTFQPVRVDNIEQHKMHRERFEISSGVCQAIEQTRARGGRVVAVGTTSVRALESAADEHGKLHPQTGDTDIFIYPGYRFRCVDAMITNFHLPKSTLLMMVSAFAGYQTMMNAYQHAVHQQYRFFSYGDAMLLEYPN
jgi:S-adenosylmethionine:tRNA ribosyltransferase-isomerase